ncbi:TetR/AcrR family transcriptional regulator [Kitasatospora purpeofusca]|uniref:TetR/AcrR family transcriptional regulator n=1 Tax=Kitasatospora purpeofusca TaxID=67352 RepID=UPI002E117BFC|nr:TetR/AcrR family transcriptional regulator [Kitasatospora purpeofusca]
MTDGSPDESGQLSRRERLRADTVEEIKRAALTLIVERGAANLRFTDIARSMGMTPPALYRYFADRDELLTALVADSYDSLSDALTATRGTVPPDDLDGRFTATCTAYRTWAQRNPERFALIFGSPVPGYAAPPDGPTVAAGQRAMGHMAELVADTAERGRLGSSLVPDPAEALMLAWATVHGFVTLEAHGHFHTLDQQARDRLFAVQAGAAAHTAGLSPTADQR